MKMTGALIFAMLLHMLTSSPLSTVAPSSWDRTVPDGSAQLLSVRSTCCSSSDGTTKAWRAHEPSLMAAVAIVQAAPALQAFGLAESQPLLDVASQLLGTGFHRTLQYSWRIPISSSVDGCMQAAPYSLRIVQPLPAALFADPYQLADLAKLSNMRSDAVQWNATISGSLEVERTAVESKPTVLVLQVKYGDACRISDMRKLLGVPLHARYPAPFDLQSSSMGSGAGTTWAVNVPFMAVLLACDDETVWHAVVPSDEEYQTHPAISWNLPAGAVHHSKAVAGATSVAIALVCSLVFSTAVRALV